MIPSSATAYGPLPSLAVLMIAPPVPVLPSGRKRTRVPGLPAKIYTDSLTMMIYRVLTLRPMSRRDIKARLWEEHQEDFGENYIKTACYRLRDYGMAIGEKTADGLNGWRLP